MIETPTLFILGAGASKPYGYPTGAELKERIIKNFVNELCSVKDAQNVVHSGLTSRCEEFMKRFSQSSLISIDKYLSLNPNDADIGKIAITLNILKSERQSNFGILMKNPAQDWYGYLFNKMMDGLNNPDDYKEFLNNKVAFITFNYDRSFEFFLYNSFHNSFFYNRLNFHNKIEEYIPFPIIHVYGELAKLNLAAWPTHNYKGDFNYYGSIEKLSQGIRVIGEERNGDSVKEQIKGLLPNYKRIFFLGFGFAQENLDAIDLFNNFNHEWTVFGTAKDMTRNEIEQIKRRFPTTKGRAYSVSGATYRDEDKKIRVEIDNMDCCEFLREHL